MFGICISKCKTKKLITAALTVLLLLSCVPAYFHTVKSEREINNGLKRTLIETNELVDEGGYIIIDRAGPNWGISWVLDYYYPNASRGGQIKDMSLPEFHTDKTNWLFLRSAISEEVENWVKERGYSAELIVSNGYIGTYPVWIYKISG